MATGCTTHEMKSMLYNEWAESGTLAGGLPHQITMTGDTVAIAETERFTQKCRWRSPDDIHVTGQIGNEDGAFNRVFARDE